MNVKLAASTKSLEETHLTWTLQGFDGFRKLSAQLMRSESRFGP